jgi:hypothetical protein
MYIHIPIHACVCIHTYIDTMAAGGPLTCTPAARASARTSGMFPHPFSTNSEEPVYNVYMYCLFVCVCVCVMCVCVCMCVCIYIHIHDIYINLYVNAYTTHTHTHTHTHVHTYTHTLYVYARVYNRCITS